MTKFKEGQAAYYIQKDRVRKGFITIRDTPTNPSIFPFNFQITENMIICFLDKNGGTLYGNILTENEYNCKVRIRNFKLKQITK